jgi:hypothetical protein
MNGKKNVRAVSSTITLYGDRFEQLERICFENKISATAFYNTIIEAFATGVLKIEGGENTSRRVYGDDEQFILDQMRYTITDNKGKKLL